MGRVNFNGIVISLQSIVLHGRGNLGEWPLTTALHHSRPQELPKGFFSPVFLLNTCSPNVFSGLFHPLSHGSMWAERILTPQDEVLAGTSHIHPWPTRTGWDVFQVSQGEQWQLVAATPWVTEWLSWFNPPQGALSQHIPSPAPRHILKNRGWYTAWRFL